MSDGDRRTNLSKSYMEYLSSSMSLFRHLDLPLFPILTSTAVRSAPNSTTKSTSILSVLPSEVLSLAK